MTATTTLTPQVETWSKVFWSLDYIPVVSTGKCLIDVFFLYCWEIPSDPAELSSFSFAYFSTLKEKADYRYIAFVPFIGNIALIISDAYQSYQREGEVDAAQSGDIPSIRSLLTRNTREKAIGIERGCQFEDLRHELCSAFADENLDGKAEIVNTLKRSAENNNPHAFKFLADVLLDYYATGPVLQKEIFEWVLTKCKNPASFHHESAWIKIKFMYDHYQERESIVPVYLELVKSPNLAAEKISYLADKLECLLLERRPLFLQIQNVFQQLAQLGKPLFMQKLGNFFIRQGQLQEGRNWIERAATADYLPCILIMAKLYADINDLDRAIFWYEKAVGRDPSVEPILTRLRSLAAQERARESAVRERRARAQQAQRDAEQLRRETQENLQRARQRWEEAARRNAEAQAQQAAGAERAGRESQARAAYQELQRIFGSDLPRWETLTTEQLSRVFRNWSARNHPDRGGSQETFQRANSLVSAVRAYRGWR